MQCIMFHHLPSYYLHKHTHRHTDEDFTYRHGESVLERTKENTHTFNGGGEVFVLRQCKRYLTLSSVRSLAQGKCLFAQRNMARAKRVVQAKSAFLSKTASLRAPYERKLKWMRFELFPQMCIKFHCARRRGIRRRRRKRSALEDLSKVPKDLREL